ncbi:MAG: hypothetical protein CVU51_17770 [Deltaproteobacteria bacterium HGW-Deltaproteobacteria-1]|nr:MAG: hypothetical protein CVU51_17770 [Deltaproteobacteria bacterium HGW-Deltaproteobacteria-1]
MYVSKRTPRDSLEKYIPYVITRMPAHICTDVILGSVIFRFRPVRWTIYNIILMLGMIIR